MKKEFPPSSPIPVPNSSFRKFIKAILQRIKQGEQVYLKNKPQQQQQPIVKGGFPKSPDYDYTPGKIKNHLENSHTKVATFQFSIPTKNSSGQMIPTQAKHMAPLFSQNVLLHIVYPLSKQQTLQNISAQKLEAFFESCVKKIYMWLYVASHYRSNTCSRELQINLYLTNQDKILPDTNHIIMDEEDVNTAFTTSCKPSTVINIYREEEWFKVLIHESFHCFGFDFSDDEPLISLSKKEMHKIFPLDIDLLLYETYCEINAEVLNVLFTSYFLQGNENHIYDSLYWESVFSQFQCVKVLQYNGIYFSQLSQPGVKYRENTNVFCYYVLKAILMSNLNRYFEWMYGSNQGSLSFSRNDSNMNAFIELFREPDTTTIRKMEKWFSKNRKRNDLFSKTLRMTFLE